MRLCPICQHTLKKDVWSGEIKCINCNYVLSKIKQVKLSTFKEEK